ncbi:SPOR domain-containing protein [Nibribacter ruber]|uniref:SPOR domain-containing protein n=1 Tax=Nibribacter ruber TaxID=2698458 RepID=A0A6P1P078_9BACT|nr:SPOR domain-containing protein [Nibribacter ruber]QHL86332.1 SPOR domain-containing protein [Nibribacter ruber]
MIQRHIKSLLYKYDCVIIPEFGGLITHYAPAKIHPVKHTFSPPSKRIAFNEQLKVNDGLLITTLAHQQRWPVAKAQQEVKEFVRALKEQLQANHQFELREVGMFRYNAESKLVFESLDNDNFLEHSFGLPELVSKPILGRDTLVLRGKFQDQPAKEVASLRTGSRMRRLFKIGASLVVGGLAVCGVYLYSLQQDVALSSLNPMELLSSSHAPAQEAPEVVEKAATAPEKSAAMDAYEQSLLAAQAPEDTVASSVNESTAAQEELVWGDSQKNSQKTEEVKEEAVIQPEVKKEVKKEAVEKLVEPVKALSSTTIKGKTNRFYVIMGVFSENEFASMNQKSLRKKGYQAKTLLPSKESKWHRVSVADFATEEEAQAALPTLRKDVSQELWVLNY